MVHLEGFEPSHLAAQAPQACVSTVPPQVHFYFLQTLGLSPQGSVSTVPPRAQM